MADYMVNFRIRFIKYENIGYLPARNELNEVSLYVQEMDLYCLPKLRTVRSFNFLYTYRQYNYTVGSSSLFLSSRYDLLILGGGRIRGTPASHSNSCIRSAHFNLK
jgi:hypothetical protein